MKYFLDTEFIEGYPPVRVLGIPLPKWMAKRPHTIQLVSIGIVCEDGRQYHAVSTEFNPKDADEWVTKNVLAKLPYRNASFYDSPRLRQESLMWKSNATIAYEIKNFLKPWKLMANTYGHLENEPIGIYAYYADYDWVVFCSLFGRMIDLPSGFPMYCRDLKQMLDSLIDEETLKSKKLLTDAGHTVTFDMVLSDIKKHPNYPQEENEHSALDDAKWNQKLFNFIKSL